MYHVNSMHATLNNGFKVFIMFCLILHIARPSLLILKDGFIDMNDERKVYCRVSFSYHNSDIHYFVITFLIILIVIVIIRHHVENCE